MGTGEHGEIAVADSERVQLLLDLFDRDVELQLSFLKHDRVGDVVHVLGRKTEVQPLDQTFEIVLDELLAQVALAGLHVMVGDAFDVLDVDGGLDIDLGDAAHDSGLVIRKPERAGLLAERDEILGHHVESVFDEPKLAHRAPQIGGLVAVAAVDRANRGQ